MTRDIQFYIDSLNNCFSKINNPIVDKALKDRVGLEYELHRKRLYEQLGLKVDKRKIENCFDADWIIENDIGQIVAIEEDKGHYVDSCFAERAIIGFAKIASHYLKQNSECPYLILSSSTRYSKFEHKLNETLDILRSDVSEVLKNKIRYFPVAEHDRLPKAKWVPNTDKPIIFNHQVCNNIANEINFIKSLKG